MGKQTIFLLAAALALTLTACGAKESANPAGEAAPPAAVRDAGETAAASTLQVRFGQGGDPFPLYLEDNQTASDIAGHVGSADWNLPIYHYDDYDNWEVMQYYDIPSRYEVADLSETVTNEKAGEVYYSAPNRIILFYHDAEVEGEYTLVGHFDASDAFAKAVEDNPVLEGWGNKIVSISAS